MKGISFEIHKAKNNQQLLEYLSGLSNTTKKRFGPHSFEIKTINNLAANPGFRLYTAFYRRKIIAYAIIKIGWLDHEKPRLMKYGIVENYHDITLAPSVADEHQNKGIGTHFLQFILDDIDSLMPPGNIYLWGGVQKNNKRAVHFYQKMGFTILGEFKTSSTYLDMNLNRRDRPPIEDTSLTLHKLEQ
ncbi:GNAT family N-acetyltransferase [Carboxylicivirga linearis]|uniref:GNAT family N-acetyltransferase n=1 Tax=Carboxylicivirga linearis TaxID=1628157 RepID=A0ABS5JRY3_9BACT|nr:GNAT family N-acetyltransferase [Carboxylicivirga linearis]MBS2097656.1 GNAT family N-acetyltransferase [Carboxylicivirga linearis]